MTPSSKRSRRPKPGDVLLLNMGDSVAYLHYVGRHPRYGDGVLVGRQLGTQTDVSEDLFSASYFTFYPAAAAVAQGLVEVVGHISPPPLPQRLRRSIHIGQRFVTWIVEDGAGETHKAELSKED